jgi:putative oxidoreductase
MLQKLIRRLDAARPYAPILIRVAFGYHIVQYSYGEVLFLQAHLGFAEYLGSLGVPFPKVMAYVAMGTEFFGGLLWIVGLWVRPAAFLLIGNFVTALLLVHLNLPYLKSFEAIQMLAVSLFLLVNGAGRLSVDHWLLERKMRRVEPMTGGG